MANGGQATLLSAFAHGQLVQVYSNSSSAWVDANVLEVLPDASVRVQYGNSQKVIPREFQPTILRHKACASDAPLACYRQDETVEVYSKTHDNWVAGVVRAVLPDGSIHVQYSVEQHLYKVIPPHLQKTMRSAFRSAQKASSVLQKPLCAAARNDHEAPSALQDPLRSARRPGQESPLVQEPLPSEEAVALVAESARLRKTIEEQQRQLNALIAAQQLHSADVATGRGNDCGEHPVHDEIEVGWRCERCNLQNSDQLLACSVCFTPRLPREARASCGKAAGVDPLRLEWTLASHGCPPQTAERALVLVGFAPPVAERASAATRRPLLGLEKALVLSGLPSRGVETALAPKSSSPPLAARAYAPVLPDSTRRCSRCTYENDSSRVECEICGTALHGAKAPLHDVDHLCAHAGDVAIGQGSSIVQRADVVEGAGLPSSSVVVASVPQGRPQVPRRCFRCTVDIVGAPSECKVCGALLDVVSPDRAARGVMQRTLDDSFAVGQRSFIPPQTVPISFGTNGIVVANPSLSPVGDARLEHVVVQDPPEDMVEVGASSSHPPLRLPRALHDQLRDYQREGVAWMWRLYCERKGGILADEMGLGKTIQACGLLRAGRAAGATHALVLVPVTLIDQWAKEICRWCPGCPVHVYYGTVQERSRALRAVMVPRGGVLLTSYNIAKGDTRLLHVAESPEAEEPLAPSGVGGWVGRKRPRDEVGAGCGVGLRTAAAGSVGGKAWDIVICDEAHVMRTVSTLLGKALRDIRAVCRVLLTGTPVQNALQDLWALMDFAQPGLLGNHITFLKRFSDPIEKGSVRGASAAAVALKRHLCEQLWQLVGPHLLRRTKEGVGLLLGEDEQRALRADDQAGGIGALATTAPLPPKVETVVWLLPTKEQTNAYKKILATSEVVREANSKGKLGIEVFRAIGLLKRLCNHPVLGLPVSQPSVWQEILPELAAAPSTRSAARGTHGRPPREALMPAPPQARAGDPTEAQADSAAAEGAEAGMAVEKMLQALPKDVDALIAQSAKLRCLSSLLPALAARGHRTLIFSQGVKMMDLVEVCVLRRHGLDYLRIDGKTDISTRAECVRKFQSERDRYKCMLLTTRVGGYGLTLTGADRVVLLDPAWNPATDMQAIDRAHRIGQDRQVRTYRLIMSGLIEDKMFRLQVFKMGLTKTAFETRQQNRYFTSNEIRGLFEWTNPAKGETRRLLVEKHGEEEDEQVQESARTDGAHQGWLKAGPALGLSNFSTLYTSLAQDEDDQDEDFSEEVKDMKVKVCQAEQNAQDSVAARQAAEAILGAAQQGIDGVAQEVARAAEARSQAAEHIKVAQGELTQARRQEAAAERALAKASQAQEAAQKQLCIADESRLVVVQASEGSELHRVQVEGSRADAERELSRAMTDVDEMLVVIGHSGVNANSIGLRSFVTAPPSALAAARKSIDRAQKALQAGEASHASSRDAVTKLLSADERCSDCDADVAIASKYGDAPDAKSPKDAQAALRVSEKDRARAEKAVEKAQERLSSTREASAEAVADVRGALALLAEAFEAREGALQRDVKAAQQEMKATARSLGATWQALRAAREAASKAEVPQRKLRRAALTAAAACSELRARCAMALREYDEATTELQACRERLAAREAAVERAGSAGVTTEAQDAGRKRERDELRGELDAAKRALKASRMLEKETVSKREAVYRHFAKAGDGVKDELAAVRTDARAAADQREHAIAALQALTGEAYDPNQVVDAYESKRKAPTEGE